MKHQAIFAEKFLKIKMDLFQLDKEVKELEEKKSIIHNWIKQIQSGRIDKQKEEAIQADFLNRFFGDVLAYDYRNPEMWLLEKELKTPLDGTKADGGLGYFKTVDGKEDFRDVRVAIELKDGRTNLDKPQNRKNDKRTPVEQAFGYANKFGESCQWVIVSNFKQIRLYNKQLGQSRYEVWNISELMEETNLKRFFFLLHSERLFFEKIQSPVQHLFETRQAQEAEISERFYKKYKETRLSLFGHIREHNPGLDEIELFGKAQKLLDRIIFVCFCEDFNIIPYYTFRKLLRASKEDVFAMSDDKIYNRVKGLFQSIDKGNPAANINRFNGGLFAPDSVLDNLIIKDNILEPVVLLSDYDFATDLNVNILGHIFEQSISDIEELKAQIKGEDFDKSKGKRKKDGIFYTPEYITRYIVDKAVGGWLQERKTELEEHKLPELTNEDYATIKINKKGKISANAKIKKHIQFWESYKEKLQNIKVIDPACGSGAFLNQVFDYLYREGQSTNIELARLKGGQMDVFDLDKHILSNNIYGVDLNPESAQITKLSLWLKTANNQSELTTLDKNIQVGNSVIDDVESVGELAFVWEKRFKEVFEKNGGFDVVLGNPPYVRQELISPFKPYLESKYKTYQGTSDLYVYFIESGVERLLNPNNGIYSIIVGNKWMRANFGKPLRKWLKQKNILEIVNFGDLPVFKNVAAYPCILSIGTGEAKETFQSTEPDTLDFSGLNDYVLEHQYQVNQSTLNDDGWALVSENVNRLILKLQNQGKTLKEYTDGKVYYGIKTGLNEAFVIDETTKDKLIKEHPSSKEIIKPFLAGKEVKRYTSPEPKKYLVLFKTGITNQERKNLSGEEWLEKNYPAISQHLKPFEEKAKKRSDQGEYWWELRACAYYDEFEKPKIMYQTFQVKSAFSYDTNGTYSNNAVWIMPTSKISLCCLFNSKLGWFMISKICSQIQNGYQLIFNYFGEFPVLDSIEESKELEGFGESRIKQTKELSKKASRFHKRLNSTFQIEKLSKKLEAFYLYDFDTFLKELKKKKIKLSLKEQDEWEEYFESYQGDIQTINENIQNTDKAIDGLVYQLYGLTKEEVAIIEGNV